MGSCYSGEHIAGYHILTDMKACTIRNQKYHLRTASNRFLPRGGLNVFTGFKPSPFASAFVQWNVLLVSMSVIDYWRQ